MKEVRAQTRGRGRPPVHIDDADRQSAHRERQATRLAMGEAAMALHEKPSPAFVKLMLKRLIEQAADPAAARAELVDYLTDGRFVQGQ